MSWQYAFFFVSENFIYLLLCISDLLRLELIRLVRMVNWSLPTSYSCCFFIFRVQDSLVLCDTSLDLCSNGYFKLSSDILCRTEYRLKLEGKHILVK